MVGTRRLETPGLYRVNFEVRTLKTFSYLAFPLLLTPEKAPKRPSLDGELMAGFHGSSCADAAGHANIGNNRWPHGIASGSAERLSRIVGSAWMVFAGTIMTRTDGAGLCY
jgi:hypothetical protein